MIYSLITVRVRLEKSGRVVGSWLQDSVGTLERAIEQARQTEEVNGNKIDVAVVALPYGETVPELRLDARRVV